MIVGAGKMRPGPRAAGIRCAAEHTEDAMKKMLVVSLLSTVLATSTAFAFVMPAPNTSRTGDNFLPVRGTDRQGDNLLPVPGSDRMGDNLLPGSSPDRQGDR